jgi:hypothetical protein
MHVRARSRASMIMKRLLVHVDTALLPQDVHMDGHRYHLRAPAQAPELEVEFEVTTRTGLRKI